MGPGPKTESVVGIGELVFARLAELFDAGEYSDVTLLLSPDDGSSGNADGENGGLRIERVRSHKLMLAAFSPVMKEMMEQAVTDGHPTWVRLRGFQTDAFKKLLNTFYNGKLVLDVQSVWSMRQIAEQLGVKLVVEECDKFLFKNLSVDTCVRFLIEARKYGIAHIEEKCLQQVAKSFNAIKNTEPFLRISREVLFQLLDSNQLQAISEYSVLQAAIRWVKSSPESRSECVPDILSRIRFNLMGEEDKNLVLNGESEFLQHTNAIKRSLAIKKSRGGLDIPRGDIIKRGIIQNMRIDDIRQAGWKLVYGQPYKAHTNVRDLESIKGEFLLVAASRKGERQISLSAMGRRDKILTQTTGNEVIFENGVYWYFRPEKAFGFSPSPVIDLSVADKTDEDGDKRLSWHLHSQTHSAGDAGGYRAGNLKGINDSTEWVKLVFTLSL